LIHALIGAGNTLVFPLLAKLSSLLISHIAAISIIEVNNSRGAKAEKLRQLLEEIQGTADNLYRPLLARRDDTDRIRSTLAVLKRFRFLFSLPGSIKKNIKEQQYDKVRITWSHILSPSLFCNDASFFFLSSLK
jgi:hypothetical protein